jgi:hypothetical protein
VKTIRTNVATCGGSSSSTDDLFGDDDDVIVPDDDSEGKNVLEDADGFEDYINKVTHSIFCFRSAPRLRFTFAISNFVPSN